MLIEVTEVLCLQIVAAVQLLTVTWFNFKEFKLKGAVLILSAASISEGIGTSVEKYFETEIDSMNGWWWLVLHGGPTQENIRFRIPEDFKKKKKKA